MSSISCNIEERMKEWWWGRRKKQAPAHEVLVLTTEYCVSLIASTNSQHHLRNVFSSTALPVSPPARVHKTDSAQYSFKNINAHRRCRWCTPFGIDANGSSILQSLAHISGLVPNIDRNLVKSVAKTTTLARSISCLPSERNDSGWNIVAVTWSCLVSWCHNGCWCQRWSIFDFCGWSLFLAVGWFETRTTALVRVPADW